MEETNKTESEFRGIDLYKVVRRINQLRSDNTIESISNIGFTSKDEIIVDNSFIVTKTLEKVWYVVEKFYPFTDIINEKDSFVVMLDRNNCLHIDSNANIV